MTGSSPGIQALAGCYPEAQGAAWKTGAWKSGLGSLGPANVADSPPHSHPHKTPNTASALRELGRGGSVVRDQPGRGNHSVWSEEGFPEEVVTFSTEAGDEEVAKVT